MLNEKNPNHQARKLSWGSTLFRAAFLQRKLESQCFFGKLEDFVCF